MKSTPMFKDYAYTEIDMELLVEKRGSGSNPSNNSGSFKQVSFVFDHQKNMDIIHEEQMMGKSDQEESMNGSQEGLNPQERQVSITRSERWVLDGLSKQSSAGKLNENTTQKI